jgi:predicted N-acyltransferase
VGLTFLPALVCGPVLGYGWHIGIDPTLSRGAADAARCAILDAMEIAAVTRDVELSFAHVMDAERELMILLAARGYLRCANVPVGVLDVCWDSFDAYLDRFPSKARREFRRQINRNREDGTVIERRVAAPDDEPRLLELLDDNARKHAGLAFALGRGSLARLTALPGAQARIFTATRDGRVTAVCLMLVQGDTGYAVAVGVDQAAAGGDFTYFQIAYNALIDDAIQSRLRRLYYGRGMYEIKVRRGCTLENTWIFSRASGARRVATAAWFGLVSSWNRYKLPARARRLLASR